MSLCPAGLPLDAFVHAQHISSQLICPITQQVLSAPVVTECEHMFEESALLEWMIRSSKCPVCNKVLDPSAIKKPGRVVKNLLEELVRFCPNRIKGCLYSGPSSTITNHCKSECKFEGLRSLDDADNEIRELKEEVQRLREENTSLKRRNEALKVAEEANDNEVATLTRKLRVIEMSLDLRAAPTSFVSFDHGFSTSEGSDVEQRRLRPGNNTDHDNDGDVSSVDAGHRRRSRNAAPHRKKKSGGSSRAGGSKENEAASHSSASSPRNKGDADADAGRIDTLRKQQAKVASKGHSSSKHATTGDSQKGTS